ncbi:MAG: type II secretion system protein GspJ, partial [Thermodesulfobacteriota bacterium]
VMVASAKKARGEAGFTLLEVLIAIALMLTLVVTLYGTFFSVMTGHGMIERELTRSREIRRFLDLFNMEIEAAFFDKTAGGTLFKVAILDEGDGDGQGIQSSIEFTYFTYSRFSSDKPSSDLKYVSYYVDMTETGERALFKEVRDPFVVNKAPTDFRVPVVEEGVESLQVSGFNGKEWTTDWAAGARGSLPDMVKVELTFSDGEKYSSIARPRIR